MDEVLVGSTPAYRIVGLPWAMLLSNFSMCPSPYLLAYCQTTCGSQLHIFTVRVSFSRESFDHFDKIAMEGGTLTRQGQCPTTL